LGSSPRFSWRPSFTRSAEAHRRAVTSTPRYGSAIELLRDADTAMYAAKKLGRARYAVFDERMREDAVDGGARALDRRQRHGGLSLRLHSSRRAVRNDRCDRFARPAAGLSRCGPFSDAADSLKIELTDFGTGHSSLSYAQRLPVAGL